MLDLAALSHHICCAIGAHPAVTEQVSTPNLERLMQSVNNYITDYIKFADAKAGSILTLVGLIGAVAGAAAPTALDAMKQTNTILFAVGIGAGALTVACTCVVIFFTIDALSPRTTSSLSLVSFPDIAKLDGEGYANSVAALSTAQMQRHYAVHNVNLAKIASAKFDDIRVALKWARVAVLAAYVMLLAYAVAKVVG